MDPLSICASAVTLTQLAGSLASSLCGLAKTALNAESHVSSLCGEIATLARFLTSVDRTLQGAHQQQFRSSASLASVDDNLWHQSALALSDCQITLTELSALVSRIERAVRERKRLWRLRTAVDLKFHASELEGYRAKINKSNWALQMILHAITVSLSLRSNASQDMILLELDRLKSCIDDAFKAAVRPSGSFSTSVGDYSDARMAHRLRDLARAASSFHSAASSTAGSTVRGEGSVIAPGMWGGSHEESTSSVIGSFTPVARERVHQFVHEAVWDSLVMGGGDGPSVEPDGEYDAGLERVTSFMATPARARLSPQRHRSTNQLLVRAHAGNTGVEGGNELEIPVFEVLEDFATESMKKRDFDKATGFLREATQTRGGTVPIPSVMNRLCVRLAVCYLLQRRWRLAEPVISKLAQQGGRLDRTVCNLSHAMALAQLSEYLFDDAITTCKQALQAKRYSLGPNDPDTIDALCLLATAYDMSGNLVYTEATRRLIPSDAVYQHPRDELEFIFAHDELLPVGFKGSVHAMTVAADVVVPRPAELDSGEEGFERVGPKDVATRRESPSGVGVDMTETALGRQDRLEADTSKEAIPWSPQIPSISRSVSLPTLDNNGSKSKTRYPSLKLSRMFRSKTQLRGDAPANASRPPATRSICGSDEATSVTSPGFTVSSARSPTVLKKRPKCTWNAAPVVHPRSRTERTMRKIFRFRYHRTRTVEHDDSDDDNSRRIMAWMRSPGCSPADVNRISVMAVCDDDHDDDDHDDDHDDNSSFALDDQDRAHLRAISDSVISGTLSKKTQLLAELQDTSRPQELHGNNLSHIDVINRYSHLLSSASSTTASTYGDMQSVFSGAESNDTTDASSTDEHEADHRPPDTKRGQRKRRSSSPLPLSPSRRGKDEALQASKPATATNSYTAVDDIPINESNHDRDARSTMRKTSDARTCDSYELSGPNDDDPRAFERLGSTCSMKTAHGVGTGDRPRMVAAVVIDVQNIKNRSRGSYRGTEVCPESRGGESTEDLEATTELEITGDDQRGQGQQQQRLERAPSWIKGDDAAFWVQRKGPTLRVV